MSRKHSEEIESACGKHPAGTFRDLFSLFRRNSAFFAAASDNFLDAVLALSKKKLCAANDVVVEEGSKGPCAMYVVLWGSVELRAGGAPCRLLSPGESVGEELMLGCVARWQQTVVASTACVLCEVTATALQGLLPMFDSEFESELRSFGSGSGPGPGRAGHGDSNFEPGSLSRLSAILRLCSSACLEALEAAMTRLVFFPGEVIYPSPGDARLLAVMAGAVELDISGRVCRSEEVPRLPIRIRSSQGISWLHGEESDCADALLLGELDLLGLASRRSSLKLRARRLSEAKVLYRTSFLKVLASFPADEALLRPFLLLRAEEAFPEFPLRGLELRGREALSKETIRFFSSSVEERVYAPGAVLFIDEFSSLMPSSDHDCISMLRLNRGRVALWEDERMTGEVGPGTLLGKALRKTRAVALEVCFVSILHQCVLGRAVELFPGDRDLLLPAFTREIDQKWPKSWAIVAQVGKILRHRSIFGGMSKEALQEIVKSGRMQVFMPGDRIVEQGKPGTSMCILWQGSAHVVVEETDLHEEKPVRNLTVINTLTRHSVFGELVMLGIQATRTVSIVAATACCCWEVERDAVFSALERHREERAFLKLVEEHLQGASPVPRICMKLFGSASQQFSTLIARVCAKKICFPGEKIVDESSGFDRMFMINLGRASMEINGQHAWHLKNGSVFGLQALDLDSKKCQETFDITVTAISVCHVLMITRVSLWAALDELPEMCRPLWKLLASDRKRSTKERGLLGSIIRKRCCLHRALEAVRTDFMVVEAARLSSEFFSVWKSLSQRSTRLRQEQQRNQAKSLNHSCHWLEKRRVQMEQLQERIDMKKLISENLYQRGPLKLFKPSGEKLLDDGIGTPRPSHFQESDSPYKSPCFWRAKATPRQLPVLQAKEAPGPCT